MKIFNFSWTWPYSIYNFNLSPYCYFLQYDRKFIKIIYLIQLNPINMPYIERIHQMSYSSLSDNWNVADIYSLKKWFYGALLNCSRILMAIFFIFANTEISVKKYKTHCKLSRRHLINSFHVWHWLL